MCLQTGALWNPRNHDYILECMNGEIKFTKINEYRNSIISSTSFSLQNYIILETELIAKEELVLILNYLVRLILL
jgi:hypothetical protein